MPSTLAAREALARPPMPTALTRSSLLVVEDDTDARALLTMVFRSAGFEVAEAATGRAALRTMFDRRCDLVLLDLGLPDLDGLEVLDRLKELTQVPVIVVSGGADETTQVQALLRGADDVVVKPFSNAELLARSLALLRRSGRHSGLADIVDDGTLRVDFAQRSVMVDGDPVQLTAIDWSLVTTFVRRPGEVLSPQRLLELAWNDPFGMGPERVKFAVLRLRRRLGWTDPDTSPIEAVRGFGYRYRPRRSRTDHPQFPEGAPHDADA